MTRLMLMKPSSRRSSLSGQESANPLFILWALRILVKLGGHKNFIDHFMWNCDDLAHYLGLPVPDSVDHEQDSKIFPKQALNLLRKLHTAAEKAALKATPKCSEILTANSQRLARHLGLSELDREILAFAVALHNDNMLETAADYIGELNSSKVYTCLAIILDRDPQEIREALSKKGKLCNSGIITIDTNIRSDLKSKLDTLSIEFSDRMMASEQDPIDLIRDTVRPSKPAGLTLADYAHLGEDLTLLRHYLDEALNQKRSGVNIFVYGPPGTGKSELARLVATLCNAPLYEVAAEDSDGDPVDGIVRLRSYRAAMSFFANHRAVVLFDETEDIFNDGGMFNRSTAEKRKAWLNRMLEENPVPTIWLSNSGVGIDPAFIRRYDMAFKLDIAPQRRRKEMLKDLASEYLSPADIDIASQSEHLAPAVISRATGVLNALRERLPRDEWSSSLMRLMNNTLETQGHSRVKGGIGHIPPYYDPAFINANANLTEISSGLRQAPEARICLYGPAGTGKSAYGHWLATYLEKPLLVKRASDLISKWVGETEKLIAAAFQEAADEEAILLIDEVDSFLSDRRQATHSWETSAVNEMLTQIECFSGLFIASTNLMEGIDQAAFRRFDLKLKFDYLRQEQAFGLLDALCLAFEIAPPTDSDKRQLESMRVLTPGDFSVVARRHRLTKFRTSSEIIDQLRIEAAHKEDAKTGRPIGFAS